jgi:protein tyrosine phosphatase (PTP) superfamily phosphohydrolase (DUF442 family)
MSGNVFFHSSVPAILRKVRPLSLVVLLFTASCLSLMTGILGWALHLQVTGNFHAIEPGYAYRSNTLGVDQLRSVVASFGIRTIINLRGASPGQSWYDSEKALAEKLRVSIINVAMQDDVAPSPETLAELLIALREAPRPLLIHCKSGADRTGLASALFEYEVMHHDAATSSEQLSFAYGHFPWLGSRTRAMDVAFWAFVGEGHSQ